MKIFFINNDGGGFADELEVEEQATVGKLFSQRIPHGKPGDYMIRVNRLPAPHSQVLQEGDRCSITPTKIHGAG